MRKFMIAVVFAVFLVAGSSVFAQEEEKEDEPSYYYTNVSLEKIYVYRTGYMVMYRTGISRMARAYLPYDWFTGAASKGEVINLPAGNSWPSMSVYYKDGEFSHVRLYVHRSNNHPTWGTVPQNANLDSQFEDVEDIKLKF